MRWTTTPQICMPPYSRILSAMLEYEWFYCTEDNLYIISDCRNLLKGKFKKCQNNQIHTFNISNTFLSNTRLKLAKNPTKAKQHPEAELLLLENYSLSSYMLSPKTNMRYSKKCAKNKCVGFNEIMWLIIMKMMLTMKTGSNRYRTYKIRPRWGHKYTKY